MHDFSFNYIARHFIINYIYHRIKQHIDHSEWTDIPEILHVWRDSRVWAIDVTKPDEENWKDITPRGFGNWQYASVPSYETGKRWVITWDRAGSYADLWMVNMDGFG